MTRREIATKWTCGRSGDCCLQPAIVVTRDELKAMIEASPRHVHVSPLTPVLMRLHTPEGCPWLAREADGKATCTIYDARPFNCRRFMCLRPDPATEPYEVGGPMGCRNLSDRLDDSLHALMFYKSNSRRARKWADAHGWSKDMTA